MPLASIPSPGHAAWRFGPVPVRAYALCVAAGIVVAVAGVYFAYSATVEERYLTTQFPDAYPTYKRTTKMLLPFIF